ncbi:MAG: malto-oligosyltrehalose trehalohydrolase [Dehalococcoidia bacterium]
MSVWQLDMGARVLDGGRVRFRVWAPTSTSVEAEIYLWPEGVVRHAMERGDDGVWSVDVDCAPGTLYRYRLDDAWSHPDPCSRSQPEGVHGPSQVVDTQAFRWTDGSWRGADPQTLVIYELHVGTFTPEGTFDAVIGHLDDLAALGITSIELMPITEVPGRWNWGYDSVDPYAPTRNYGGPEGLQRLVDAAHARGLAVILDVVYNHLGPEGNYLAAFSPFYFTDRYQTPWGDAVNFDGEERAFVRRYFIDNALYWAHEYHVDGLRLDATHQIYDASPKHILQELAEALHEHAHPDRTFLLMAEDERNDLRIILPREEGGYGLDGLWIDDFHHAVHVLLTEEDRGYLVAYEGTTEEIARLIRVGYIFPEPPRDPGTDAVGVAPLIAAPKIVYCLQNHDQIGNRPYGKRLGEFIDQELLLASVALLLLTPCTPMIFMGSEWGSSSPFLYFTDHNPELGELVRSGRNKEFKDFWSAIDPARFPMPDPQAEETFLRSKLDLEERDRPGHAEVYQLYGELLHLRRDDPVLRMHDRWRMLTAAPSASIVAVERWNEAEERRLLLVNFGDAAAFDAGTQGWLGESAARSWRVVVSTAEARFGGLAIDPARLALMPGRAVELPERSATLWAAGP